MTESLQLQFFDARTKQYVPNSCFEKPGTDGAKRLADIGRASGRSYRLARVERPLKPFYRTPRPNGQSRSIADVQAAYIEWAQAKGLAQITCYAPAWWPAKFERFEVVNNRTVHCVPFTGTVRYVTPKEQFEIIHTIDMPASRPDYRDQPGA